MTSERVSKLSTGAELFYRKLLNVADDYGRFEADAAVLRARCYPRQLEKTSEAMIGEWLGECKKYRLLTVYRVQASLYLQLDKFGQRTRTASRFPAPNGNLPRPPDRNVRSNVRNVRADDGQMTVTCLPQAEANANAESNAKHFDDSAAFSGNGKGEKRKISRAGKAAAKTRPVASPGATPPLSGMGQPKAMLQHTPAELEGFRAAIRVELGSAATEAEVDRKFAEYIAPRRQP